MKKSYDSNHTPRIPLFVGLLVCWWMMEELEEKKVLEEMEELEELEEMEELEELEEMEELEEQFN